jgi:hypothetical protein
MLGHYSSGVAIAFQPFLKSLIDSVAISPQIRLNDDEMVAARSLLIDVGWHPPGS